MRLLMADRTLPDGTREAEPVTIDVSGGCLSIVLDDGERIVVAAREFACELDVEITADVLSQALEGEAA